MTAWPTRHTAADWHPTTKGQFRQMTKFREFFPYVFSIGYRHVRYVYSQLARTALEEYMLDIMYEIPKDDSIGKVVITREYIEGNGGPRILLRGQEPALIERG